MKHKVENVLGWYGVLAILVAYALVNLNYVSVRSFGFEILNLTGAIGIIIEAINKKDIQPVMLNIIWAAIALIALLHLLLR